MSKEIPDFKQGGMVDDDNLDIESEIIEEVGHEGKGQETMQDVLKGESETLGDEMDAELSRIIDAMSPDEALRVQQMTEGNLELSQNTIARLKALSERVVLLTKKYGEKFGAETAGLIVGGAVTAAGVPHGMLGTAEYGSAGLILAVLSYITIDRLHNS
jgi:hypothetical protein